MQPQSSVEQLAQRYRDAQHAIANCGRVLALARRELADTEVALIVARVQRFVRNLRG